jgi:DNA-binding transcriptional MerR regulator
VATAAAGAAVVSPSPARRADGRAVPGLVIVGEAARRSGFTIKALRFYERRGLLLPSGRSPGGYRLYNEADLRRLEFIRQAKSLGLSLDQTRELAVSARSQTCSMTRPRLLRVLDERIRQTARQIETAAQPEEGARASAPDPGCPSSHRPRPGLLRVLRGVGGRRADPAPPAETRRGARASGHERPEAAGEGPSGPVRYLALATRVVPVVVGHGRPRPDTSPHAVPSDSAPIESWP